LSVLDRTTPDQPLDCADHVVVEPLALRTFLAELEA
jgi:hypothetical protein